MFPEGIEGPKLRNFMKNGILKNFCHPDVELRLSESKGRGFYATKNIKLYTLLFVERAIAQV